MNVTYLTDVNSVTPEVVKEAVKYLKDSKSDPMYSFSTDTMKYSPDILFEKLATGIGNTSFMVT